MGRWGDEENWELGIGQMGRWADGQMGRWVDGQMGRWADGQMGRWADGEMGRWADGEMGRWADEGVRAGKLANYLVTTRERDAPTTNYW